MTPLHHRPLWPAYSAYRSFGWGKWTALQLAFWDLPLLRRL